MIFVSYDIQPVSQSKDGTCVALDKVDDSLNFWSIYGRDKAGFAFCIGDYSDFNAAREIYMAITGNTSVQAEPAVLMGLPASAQARFELVAASIIEAAAGGSHQFETNLLSEMRALGGEMTVEIIGSIADKTIAESA